MPLLGKWLILLLQLLDCPAAVDGEVDSRRFISFSSLIFLSPFLSATLVFLFFFLHVLPFPFFHLLLVLLSQLLLLLSISFASFSTSFFAPCRRVETSQFTSAAAVAASGATGFTGFMDIVG